jgi:adenosylcobinamide kinase/adenosylcobinamide-phosphate guanylyltransferase
MIFVFGGSYNGKLDYVMKTYHPKSIVDGNVVKIDELKEYECIYNFECLIKRLIKCNELDEFKKVHRLILKNKIVIGNEIGSGIVPIDAFERKWRDEVGFFYQSLSTYSRSVIRVWNGLPVVLK